MSEYQYYEFQAIDRPLDHAAQRALRSFSSRARITSTSFANHYEWGDFKGDPRKFMERWFDLHLYLANWGTRCLMMRLPKRLFSRADLAPLLGELDGVEVWTSGDNLIVDAHREEVEPGDDWDDGSSWLAALAPLRADVLMGDLRWFYLLWLTAVAQDLIPDNVIEPLPGVGPLTNALEAFAEFFHLDPDLMAAAAESSAGNAALSKHVLHNALAAIPEREKTELLLRLFQGDPYVAAELKRRLRGERSGPAAYRTAGALRKRAQEIAAVRERAEAARQAAAGRREAKEAEKARRVRLDNLRRRGIGVWRDIETEIERRNASGYEAAAALLFDLKDVATDQGTLVDFARRLEAIRDRHARKEKFIERLNKLTLG